MVILVEVIGFWIGLIWDFPNKKKLLSLDFMTCFYGSPVFVYPRVYFSNAKKDMFFDNNPTRIVIIQYRLSMLGALYMSSFDFT